ncbi:hypothetical protein [Pseudonocardia abyssalis]|uniref:Uncharacterized protein n=1 Tax=Pseudonocardia abyssalis TaxID=2792008 RepID=A0ABS6V228_9PSEU|nr:hypothetical protein [Pseudonocardia abyssalis]MBW0114170.1 hypothetical protein [Pseudonocardia abyssalis]MBW0138563.1 hypothetical protein [Pseudonocardia abyssalis]
MYDTPRPATGIRTILLLVGGLVVGMVLLVSSLLGGDGGGGGTSSEPECRTEFFDSGSISTCDGDLLYTDDDGNDFSSGG